MRGNGRLTLLFSRETIGPRLLASALGCTYALSERVSDGTRLLEHAVRETEALKIFFRYALWLAWLGEASLLAGRMGDALTFAKSAVEHAHAHKEPGHEAWAVRPLGDIAVQRKPPERERAEAPYRQALALASELGMRSLQAHCHLGFGKLYLKSGQPDQGRPELSATIALYRAMEMTFWRPQAETALAEVKGC
jgi:MalT-like TPR region